MEKKDIAKLIIGGLALVLLANTNSKINNLENQITQIRREVGTTSNEINNIQYGIDKKIKDIENILIEQNNLVYNFTCQLKNMDFAKNEATYFTTAELKNSEGVEQAYLVFDYVENGENKSLQYSLSKKSPLAYQDTFTLSMENDYTVKLMTQGQGGYQFFNLAIDQSELLLKTMLCERRVTVHSSMNRITDRGIEHIYTIVNNYYDNKGLQLKGIVAKVYDGDKLLLTKDITHTTKDDLMQEYNQNREVTAELEMEIKKMEMALSKQEPYATETKTCYLSISKEDIEKTPGLSYSIPYARSLKILLEITDNNQNTITKYAT
jgi:hypothetical protein